MLHKQEVGGASPPPATNSGVALFVRVSGEPVGSNPTPRAEWVVAQLVVALDC